MLDIKTCSLTAGSFLIVVASDDHSRRSPQFKPLTTSNQTSPRTRVPPSSARIPEMGAPLPSPTAPSQDQRLSFQPLHRPRPSLSQTGVPQVEQGGSSSTSAHQTHQQQSARGTGDGTRVGINDPSTSSPFLRDFTLVAEAAKRAQLAVVMRDLGDVTL